MRRLADQIIYDERVNCDNIYFHNVIFDGCVLTLSRRNAKEGQFTGRTQARHCKFVGDGWNDATLTLNAEHLAQRPEPRHEVEVTMTKAERKAVKAVSTAGFVAWLRSVGLK